jgi:hypothetical protein
MAIEFKILTDMRLWLVQRRIPLTVISMAVGTIAIGMFFQPPANVAAWFKWSSFGVFVLTTAFTVFLSITPHHYERIKYATSILPAICYVLQLDSSTRVTIHHIRSKKAQTYEQITPYYPTNTGQGRQFVFTQGITGQAFRTRLSQAYSIPNGTSLAEDYRRRWSFTNEEISRLSQDRRSFYAYPVGQEGAFAKVVLYFDSANPSTFADEKKMELDSNIEKLFLRTLECLFVTEKAEASA